MTNTVDANTLKNMSKPQQIAAGGGVAALIATFLPWYSVGDQFFSYSVKGTSFGFGWMGMVLLVAAAALTIAPAFGKKIGTDQISGEQIALIAAGVGGVMWLIRLVSVPFGISRSFGLFVAILAGAAVIAGVVMNMKEQGIAMPTLANFQNTNDATPTAPQAAPAPQQYAAPAPAPQAAPAPQQYAAPAPAPQAAPAPQQYAAPAPAPQAPPAGTTEF